MTKLSLPDIAEWRLQAVDWFDRVMQDPHSSAKSGEFKIPQHIPQDLAMCTVICASCLTTAQYIVQELCLPYSMNHARSIAFDLVFLQETLSFGRSRTAVNSGGALEPSAVTLMAAMPTRKEGPFSIESTTEPTAHMTAFQWASLTFRQIWEAALPGRDFDATVSDEEVLAFVYGETEWPLRTIEGNEIIDAVEMLLGWMRWEIQQAAAVHSSCASAQGETGERKVLPQPEHTGTKRRKSGVTLAGIETAARSCGISLPEKFHRSYGRDRNLKRFLIGQESKASGRPGRPANVYDATRSTEYIARREGWGKEQELRLQKIVFKNTVPANPIVKNHSTA